LVLVVANAFTQCADSTNSYAHRAAHHLPRCSNIPPARAPKQTAATHPCQGRPQRFTIAAQLPTSGATTVRLMTSRPLACAARRSSVPSSVAGHPERSEAEIGHGPSRAQKTDTAARHRSALAHASCREATHKTGRSRGRYRARARSVQSVPVTGTGTFAEDLNSGTGRGWRGTFEERSERPRLE
jgi:hypothetical protein